MAAGKLAASQSANPKVKEFGEKMVRDHGASGAQLERIAAAHGAPVPKGLDEEHARQREHLASLKGDQFDREYIALMVKDHDEDTKKFADEQRTTQDAQLKQFAEQTLAVVKEHDQMVHQIAGSLGINSTPSDRRS